jgi:hypothetical protein
LFGVIEISTVSYLLALVYYHHSIVSRQQHVISLLEDGQPHAFMHEVDKDIARCRGQRFRHCLQVNRVAGLCYLGHFQEAYDELRGISPDSLPRLFKVLYFNNLLIVLLCMDRRDEARALVARHGHVLTAATRHRKMEDALRGTRAIYDLVCGDHDAGRAALEQMVALPGRRFKPMRLYFLGLDDWRAGHAEAARRWLSEAAERAPQSFIPRAVEEMGLTPLPTA